MSALDRTLELPSDGFLTGVSESAASYSTLYAYKGPLNQGGIWNLGDPSKALVCDPGIAENMSGPNITIGADGYAYDETETDSRRLLACYAGVPAKQTGARRYVFDGLLSSDPLANGGFRFAFNYQNESNYWIAYLAWISSRFQVYFYHNSGGSWTLKGSQVSMSTTVDTPMKFRWTILDAGDRISNAVYGQETDALADYSFPYVNYNQASRPLKDETGFYLMPYNPAGNEFRIRSFTVEDV